MRAFIFPRWLLIIVLWLQGIGPAWAESGSTLPAASEATQALLRAQALREAGRYSEAILFAQRALELRSQSPGAPPAEVAEALRDLGQYYRLRGDFPLAAPLLEQALALQEAALGPRHLEVARTLDVLSQLASAQLDFTRALSLSERALALKKESLGPEHAEVATTLHLLANHYLDQGKYAQAEPLYRQALAMREKFLGREAPAFSMTLNNLATLYTYQGRYAEAEPMHQQALAIREEHLGPEHPDTVQALRTLALNWVFQGKYAQAEALYLRALAVSEKNSPINMASILRGLAMLYYRQGHIQRALPFLERFYAAQESFLWSGSAGLSETQLLAWRRRYRQDEETLYSLARAWPQEKRLRELALTFALNSKDRAAEEVTHLLRNLHQQHADEVLADLHRLRELRAQMSTLLLDGPSSGSPMEVSRRLPALLREAETLEVSLARRLAPLRTALRPEHLRQQVAARLPPGSALIEYVRYNDMPPSEAVGAMPLRRKEAPRYLAFLLFPDGDSRLADLGPADEIDAAVTRLQRALSTPDGELSVAREVYERVFRPVRELLGGTRTLFLSPDGALGLVPFVALHDGHTELLSTFTFVHLSSGRQLLASASRTGSTSSFVVMAVSDFGTSRGPPFPQDATRSLIDLMSLKPLANARRESQAIQSLYPQAQLLLDREASRDALLRLESPGVLHIITHGFFNGTGSPPPDTRALLKPESLGPPALGVEKGSLVRSGLVVADTPDAQAGGGPKNTVVTALELAGMNLWGTQLVVLSACQTGLGEAVPNQGVFGLRRAFMQAGAETLVSSLWSVQDDSTALLMAAYYRRLRAGEGRISALHGAMRELRKTHPHPFFWAPFIGMGQDTPLRGIGAVP